MTKSTARVVKLPSGRSASAAPTSSRMLRPVTAQNTRRVLMKLMIKRKTPRISHSMASSMVVIMSGQQGVPEQQPAVDRRKNGNYDSQHYPAIPASAARDVVEPFFKLTILVGHFHGVPL